MSQGEGGGRKLIVLTNEQTIQVEALAAYLSQDQIADYLGIARNTFSAIMDRNEDVFARYKKGKAKAIETMAKGLIQQGIEGNTTAQIFYLKTQAGWKETQVNENVGKDGGPIVTKNMTEDRFREIAKEQDDAI
jgi:IS30 family transposase